ncbi:MAG: alpha/beta fold hydrolase [Nitrospira sp.]|nr:alpha/beta fold hydrolase [Nitrospira sp.]
MKRSSSWHSLVAPHVPDRACRQPYAALLTFILLCPIMTACSSPSSIPTHFDAIERMPVHTVLVHGQRIAYLDVGAGPPVILIHGFGGSMWQWEYQQHQLSQHFRVLTLDLPGAGLSDKPDIDYRPDQMLDYFVGFMDAMKIPQATLVGNSMGAGLAIGMALTHPARVAKLALVDGLPQHVMEKLTSPSVRRALETSAPSWLVSFGNTLFGSLMIESVLQEIVYDPALLTPAVLDRSKHNRRRPGLIKPIMTVRENLPLWESGFATRLATITHPTLVLWGEEDRVFPIAVGEELHRTIKGSRFIRIPKAGHIPQWERPDVVNRELITFIRP